MQHRPLRVGVLVGAYLTAVMAVSLALANRMPALEPMAEMRNAASYAAFGLAAVLPVWIFRREPGSLFVASIAAWGLFSVMYALAGLAFDNLFVRLHKTPLNVFMLGACVYGLLAVVAWVAAMIDALRHAPATAGRRRH
jgi:hypothetical protein